MGIEISSTTTGYDQRMAGNSMFPAISASDDKDAKGAKRNDEQVKEQKARDEEIARLKKRDQEVRAHEQAHVAAGGRYVKGGASYSYSTGPDGRRYATGGEVSIDTSPGRTPEETIQKAQAIRAAALAPAQPSGQDLSVASAASSMEAAARAQLAQSSFGKSESSMASAMAADAYEQTSTTVGSSSRGTLSVWV
jgi:hypothetical protein